MNHQAPERFIAIISQDHEVSQHIGLRLPSGIIHPIAFRCDVCVLHGPAQLRLSNGKILNGFKATGEFQFLN